MQEAFAELAGDPRTSATRGNSTRTHVSLRAAYAELEKAISETLRARRAVSRFFKSPRMDDTIRSGGHGQRAQRLRRQPIHRSCRASSPCGAARLHSYRTGFGSRHEMAWLQTDRQRRTASTARAVASEIIRALGLCPEKLTLDLGQSIASFVYHEAGCGPLWRFAVRGRPANPNHPGGGQ